MALLFPVDSIKEQFLKAAMGRGLVFYISDKFSLPLLKTLANCNSKNFQGRNKALVRSVLFSLFDFVLSSYSGADCIYLTFLAG